MREMKRKNEYSLAARAKTRKRYEANERRAKERKKKSFIFTHYRCNWTKSKHLNIETLKCATRFVQWK